MEGLSSVKPKLIVEILNRLENEEDNLRGMIQSSDPGVISL